MRDKTSNIPNRFPRQTADFLSDFMSLTSVYEGNVIFFFLAICDFFAFFLFSYFLDFFFDKITYKNARNN